MTVFYQLRYIVLFLEAQGPALFSPVNQRCPLNINPSSGVFFLFLMSEISWYITIWSFQHFIHFPQQITVQIFIVFTFVVLYTCDKVRLYVSAISRTNVTNKMLNMLILWSLSLKTWKQVETHEIMQSSTYFDQPCGKPTTSLPPIVSSSSETNFIQSWLDFHCNINLTQP